jgi:hypothetical protein
MRPLGRDAPTHNVRRSAKVNSNDAPVRGLAVTGLESDRGRVNIITSGVIQ